MFFLGLESGLFLSAVLVGGSWHSAAQFMGQRASWTLLSALSPPSGHYMLLHSGSSSVSPSVSLTHFLFIDLNEK